MVRIQVARADAMTSQLSKVLRCGQAYLVDQRHHLLVCLP
jgi:hypothetical protein